jgi:Ca2+:H+ antiporter
MPRWMWPLLVAGGLALAARLLGGAAFLVFVLAALGLIPLAALIGRATEDLAYHVGPRLGGLLNATFGNAAELIIAGLALREGLTALVKASITGAIIGTLLLVLGTSLLVGGWRHGIQQFDAREAGRNATMMAMALVSLLLPAVFASVAPNAVRIEAVSVAVAVVLLLVYAAYLTYILREGEPLPGAAVAPGSATAQVPWARTPALLVLLAATVGTVVLAELLVQTVEAVTATLGWSEFFVGLIIVPLVGNSAEHFGALALAARNKMDTALAIAAGSSTQIALLVAPLLVLLGWGSGHWLTLVFHPLEIIAVAAAAFLFAFVSVDGETTWLEGVQLLALYAMVGAVFFFLPVTS